LGHLVCKDCGAVLESIYDDSMYIKKEDNRTKKYNPLTRSENIKPQRNIERNIENISPKIIKRGKILKLNHGKISISSIIDQKLNKIENNKDFKISYQILQNYPTLKSRTKRNKHAIALYALYRSYNYSKMHSINLVSKELGISKYTLKNILYKQRKTLDNYIAELAHVIENNLKSKP
jgi:hypothetical protein